MTIALTPFLRNALKADMLFSAVGAVLLTAGASLLAPLTELPHGLLLGSGIFLIPWTAFLAYCASRNHVARLMIVDVIAINALWVAASAGLLVSGYIAPNWLGIAFIVVQALVVAVLTELQIIGMRRAQTVAA